MANNLRIIAAQLNFLVGDIFGNAEKIIINSLRARNEYKADLIIFPEMAIVGYPAEDLLLRADFYQKANQALDLIVREVKGIYVLVGFPDSITANKITNRYNSAALIYNGKIIAIYRKQQLPNYGVFDEKRYFVPGNKPCIVKIKNTKIAITICEDMWFPYQMQEAKKAGAQLAISINASPFDLYKPYVREKIMSLRAREGKMPLIYVNCVGGQDELVFDGGSMVVNAKGHVTERAAFFIEQLVPVELILEKTVIPKLHKILPISGIEERAYNALVLGVRDYINKNNFKGAIIAVSGGIDSALTLAIAVDAIGKDRVETVFMPSRYTRKISQKIARIQTKILQVKYSEISIEPIFKAYLHALKKEFAKLPKDVAEENLQARSRAALLMALSNKKNLIVLSTGNKSEMSVGYSTLYGDMVGGFCVLKDVLKTMVYRLARFRNSLSVIPIIPEEALKRLPSAELAYHQKDTDTLPPYSILDEILERYIEKDQSKEEIIAAGFKKQIVEKIVAMVIRNEYKRRQAPTGVRITMRAFGRDRRYPITSKFA